MIHRHLLTAIHEYLAFYLDPNNEQTTLEALKLSTQGGATTIRTLDLIRQKPPVLKVHSQAGSGDLPLVVSQLLSRRVTERPLGHSVDEMESAISKQDAKIEVFARTAEEAELLTDLIVKCLYQSRRDFLLNGYINYTVDALEELSPQEELASEELGLFLRRVSISAMVQEEIARVIPTPILGVLTLDLKPTGGVGFFNHNMI